MVRQNEAVIPVMEAEASKTRSLEIAFVIDTEHLRQLENVLREVGDAPEYQVKFSDGHALQLRDIKDVLKQPNSRTRAIVSLIAGVTGRGGKQSIYVVLKDAQPQPGGVLASRSSSSPSVEYTVTGTQRNVIYLGDELDEWTAGIRQWYSAFYHGVLSFALFIAIIAVPIWLWKSASQLLFTSEFLKRHDWLQAATVVGLWVAIYWTFKLFPRATFAIGQGIQRHRFFIYLRNTVLLTFLLSVVASMLANWITHRL
jgi:hypothetical protein